VPDAQARRALGLDPVVRAGLEVDHVDRAVDGRAGLELAAVSWSRGGVSHPPKM
jgi:hypothetical protein